MTKRYEDWTHVRVNGDRHAAAPYLVEGRKLLGEVFEEAARNGLGVHVMHRPLEDGAVIVAEKYGEIPRITITPPVKPEGQIKVAKGDFVVHPRNADFPDGIHPEYPEQILQYRDGQWRTFFYSGEAEGYDDFDGSKGVYLLEFPEGVRHAGNVDWRARDGSRISWYGPSTRYWYDAWRQPSAQYGRFVFYLGQVLLDVDQFCADNDEDWQERLVLGAGMAVDNDGVRWLYVMLANIPDQYAGTVPMPGGVHLGHNYPLETIPHRLRRVRMLRNPTLPTHEQWSVPDEESVAVWYGELERACSTWVFNPDCTRATTFFQVDPPAVVYRYPYWNDVWPLMTPPAHSSRCDVTISGASGAHAITEVSLAPGASEADVAVDYDFDGVEVPIRIGRGPHGVSAHAVYLRMGSVVVPLYWYSHGTVIPTINNGGGTVRRLLTGCDARVGVVSADRREWSWNNGPVFGVNVGIRRVSAIEVVGAAGAASTVLHDASSTVTGTPQSWYDYRAGGLEASAGFQLGPLTWIWKCAGNADTATSTTTGMTASVGVVPHHPSECFGQLGNTAVSGTATDMVSNNRLDAHGKRAPMTLAADESAAVLSQYDPRSRYSDLVATYRDESVAFATDSTMAAVTGVSGANARWHPCWVLGNPIGGLQ